MNIEKEEQDELEYTLATILQRKINLLLKNNQSFATFNADLKEKIKLYEDANWSNNSLITDKKVNISDKCEEIAESFFKNYLKR